MVEKNFVPLSFLLTIVVSLLALPLRSLDLAFFLEGVRHPTLSVYIGGTNIFRQIKKSNMSANGVEVRAFADV